ncbi:MAG: hypothetical protein JXR37_31165 [Kiritimatiellae bacterium]|nr:hypothetical protein [Kiritimatiellia bacterium]
MRVQLRQFRAIAALTALEAIRQPVCLLLTLTCVLATGLVPFLVMYQFGEQGKLVRDSALALHFLLGVFLAGTAACAALSREIKSGTASTVASKPVRPELFFLAKFAGIAALVLLFSGCALTATLLSERAAPKLFNPGLLSGAVLFGAPVLACALAAAGSFLAKRHFVSDAFVLLFLALCAGVLLICVFDERGRIVAFGSLVQWRIVPAGILVTLALLVLAGTAAALATRLHTAATLSACTVVFLLGLMSDYLFGRHAPHSVWAGWAYRVLPNWQHFWLADALTAGGTIAWTYVIRAGLYAFVYLAGVLCLGMVSFRHRELT